MTKRSSLAILATLFLLAACGEGDQIYNQPAPNSVEPSDDDGDTQDKNDSDDGTAGLACVSDGSFVNIAIDMDEAQANDMQIALYLQFEDSTKLALNNGWGEIPHDLESLPFSIVDADGVNYGAEGVAEFTSVWAGETDLQVEAVTMLTLQVACP